jgi:AcrR family transcriptional regulator
MSRRSYDNTTRAAQARATRRRVVEAARDLIVSRGPTAVTMRDIAGAAQVSPETVYKSFGTKAAVIKAVYDVTLVGDDEPVAMVDRPERQAIAAATDPREKIRLYAASARGVSVRLGPLLARLRAAALAGDDTVVALMSTVDDERLTGTTMMVAHLASSGCLRTDLPPEQARDIVWALISPELYDALVVRRGWSPDDYEHWLAESLTDALLRRDHPTADSAPTD